MFKMYRDYIKVDNVIDSCSDFYQTKTACNLVHNFGKLYGYNCLWSKLDKKVSDLFFHKLDEIEFLERKGNLS